MIFNCQKKFVKLTENCLQWIELEKAKNSSKWLEENQSREVWKNRQIDGKNFKTQFSVNLTNFLKFYTSLRVCNGILQIINFFQNSRTFLSWCRVGSFHGTAIRILNFDLFTNSLNLILQSFNLIGNACKLVEIFCKGKFL